MDRTTDVGDVPIIEGRYPVASACVRELRRNGHTVVRGLATVDEIAALREPIEKAVRKHARHAAPLEQRDTYGRAFLQVPNLWRRDRAIERFVLSPRFARVAADLLGVEGVRLYHDQALCKEPGGGFTPWHQDQVYWPLDTDATITMWMPLVHVPDEIGSMTFASGSHHMGDLGAHVIGDGSEAFYRDLVAEHGFPLETHGALRAGDATFHTGWALHRAPANGTDRVRSVMTVIYFADGARVGAVDSVARRFDQRLWLDGIEPGELAAGPLNPRLWPVSPTR